MSLSSGGILTVADDIIIGDGKTIGSASTVDAITIASNGVTTFSQIPVLPANSIDSDYYVDGSIDTAHIADGQITTAKLATAVFTGATDIGAAIADADLFLMDDGAGGTIRKTAASRIKTYAGSPAGTLACSARRSSDLAVAGTTQVEIVLNQAAVDPDSKFNTSNGRYTPGVAGNYFVSYGVTLTYNAGGTLAHTELNYFKVRLNGTGTEFAQVGPSGSDHDGVYFYASSAIIAMDDDDYISLWHYSADSGGSVMPAQQATLNIFRLD